MKANGATQLITRDRVSLLRFGARPRTSSRPVLLHGPHIRRFKLFSRQNILVDSLPPQVNPLFVLILIY